MIVEVKVCNVCKRVGVQTTEYTLMRDGAEAEVDLCEEDAAPIEVLFDQPEEEPEVTLVPTFEAPARKAPAQPATPKAPAKKAPAQRSAAAKKTAAKPARRRSSKVTSLEEIEAQKKK